MMDSGNFHWKVVVLFDGKVYPSNHLPWYYLLKLLFLTTPVTTLVSWHWDL